MPYGGFAESISLDFICLPFLDFLCYLKYCVKQRVKEHVYNILFDICEE